MNIRNFKVYNRKTQSLSLLLQWLCCPQAQFSSFFRPKQQYQERWKYNSVKKVTRSVEGKKTWDDRNKKVEVNLSKISK